MINFDINKLRYEYVYVKKISQFSIVVKSDVNKKTFEPSYFKDYKINKNKETVLNIHKSVYDLYKKNKTITSFAGKGKKACIFFYDDSILNIDVYSPYAYVINHEGGNKITQQVEISEKEWTSSNVKAFSKIKEKFDEKINNGEIKPENIFIDGRNIFCVTDEITHRYVFKIKDFHIKRVLYFNLAKVAFSSLNKKPKKEKEVDETNENDEKIEDENITLILKEGFVVAYNPFDDKNKFVYSSVITNEYSKRQNGAYMGIPFNIFTLDHLDDKHTIINDDKIGRYYMNLIFLLRSGNVIGKHYGHKETDFLDIPSIIKETGIINLNSDISRESRLNYAIKINPFDAMAYLFRYMYKEKNLNVYRDLESLFRYSFSTGLVSVKKIGNIFKENKSLDNIKAKVNK